MKARRGNWRLAIPVALATLGWASQLSAAIVVDQSLSPAGSQIGSAGMSAPVPCPIPQAPWWDRGERPLSLLDALLPSGSASAPSSSSGASAQAVVAILQSVVAPPPPAVTPVYGFVDLFSPSPPPWRLLRPPRWA